jgi:hypothetical protein
VKQTIEVDSIARLDIKPGETLLVTVPTPTSRDEVHAIRDAFMTQLPEGVRVLIKSGDIEVSVVAGRS